LREEVGFAGVCVSDDLEMAAIVQHFGVLDSAPNALAAGCDAVLVCHTLALQHGAIDAIARSARTGPLAVSRLEEAAARMEALFEFAAAPKDIDPFKAAAACATPASLAFVASLGAAVAQAADPTEGHVRRPS
jgi:beta-N-acetylhexosaminidase